MSPLLGFNATFEGQVKGGLQKTGSNFLITTLEGNSRVEKFTPAPIPVKPTVLAPRTNNRNLKKGIAFGSAL
jgi:hypothetical protein